MDTRDPEGEATPLQVTLDLEDNRLDIEGNDRKALESSGSSIPKKVIATGSARMATTL